MAKFYGNIGYIETKQTSPGIYKPVETIRPYYGKVESRGMRWDQRDKINDDLTITNIISVVSDHFANENLGTMRWVEYMGTKWRIVNIQVSYPEIKLSLGGVYNV